MDVCKPGRSYYLVKVHQHLEQRRNDEEQRNDITRMRINLVVLLYLLDDVLTTKKSGKTAFCQDWHNSSVHLIRESRLYLLQKSLPEYIHIRWYKWSVGGTGGEILSVFCYPRDLWCSWCQTWRHSGPRRKYLRWRHRGLSHRAQDLLL